MHIYIATAPRMDSRARVRPPPPTHTHTKARSHTKCCMGVGRGVEQIMFAKKDKCETEFHKLTCEKYCEKCRFSRLRKESLWRL